MKMSMEIKNNLSEETKTLPGDILREKREQLGLSKQDIAENSA